MMKKKTRVVSTHREQMLSYLCNAFRVFLRFLLSIRFFFTRSFVYVHYLFFSLVFNFKTVILVICTYVRIQLANGLYILSQWHNPFFVVVVLPSNKSNKKGKTNNTVNPFRYNNFRCSSFLFSSILS